MQNYLSIGTNFLAKDLEQPITNSSIKPSGGLWATIQDPENIKFNPWMEYLSMNPYVLFYKQKNGDPFKIPAVLITLKNDANVFTLTNTNELDFLKKHYPRTDNWIDFQKLSQDFDAIFIKVKGYNNISSEDQKKLNSFVVDSLIIFNLDCIKHYQKANIDIEPYDYIYESTFTSYDINIESTIEQIIENTSEEHLTRKLT